MPAMERQTRQRQAVLDAIDHAGRALAPAEILEMAQRSVASLNLSTIYRHLNALQDEARVVKVLLPGQAAARFEAVCHGDHGTHGHRDAGHGDDHGHDHDSDQGHHHHHFHCNGCDRVYPLHACPGSMQDLVPEGFVVQAHEITLSGLCADCRRTDGAAS
jgi:Fur family ferric uptake transcriptional regulator